MVHVLAISPDEVILVHLNVRVCYDNNPLSSLLQLVLHLVELIFWEFISVKSEVAVAVGGWDVKPEHVQFHAAFLEPGHVINHSDSCSVLIPLRVVEP